MFRKLVSNLPFSPALVGQLSFYARRLRKEEATRKAGLIVTALALVVQSFAVFSPPEAVNASSAADFIPGGVSSKQDLLSHYDRNTGNLKRVLGSLGITRAELSNTSKRTIGERGYFNWSKTSLYSHSQGQRSWDYGGGTVYYRPMTLTAGADTSHQVLAGHSSTFGWFAIKIDCGNIVTDKPPKKPNPRIVCDYLKVRKLSAAWVDVRLEAKAIARDGAKIKGYTFTITHGGKTTTKKVDTSKSTASVKYRNSDPGLYRVQVKVRSSLGLKTSTDCKGNYEVKTDAECESLTVSRISSSLNQFKVVGKSDASKGVKIQKYIYQVFNKDGKKIGAPKEFASKNERHSFTYEQQTPGAYKMRLAVVTSIGKKEGSSCRDRFTVKSPPQLAAACTNADAEISNRTIVSLTGSAQTSGGATVSKYDFTVKDASGAVVREIPVESTQLSVGAPSFELTKPGEYTVQLTVTTSVGPKTNTDNCVDAFTIAPPEWCPYKDGLQKDSPECQPCPDNPDIWIKDDDCASDIINTKTATNTTQGNVNAITKAALAGDRIIYTLNVENKGILSDNVTIRESLGDVLEYANLVDSGGGTFDKKSKILTWPEVTIGGGATETRSFVVQMMEKIPLTNTGTSDEDSYDCKMVNTFGNSVEIDVKCANEKKVVEQVVKELPETGPGENMIFAGSLFAIVSYFYARSRQLGKEVRLVRKKIHAGTI